MPLISTVDKHTTTLLFTLPWGEGGLEKYWGFLYGNLGERGLSEVTRDVYSEVRSRIWVSRLFCLGYSSKCRDEHTDGPGFVMPHQYLSLNCKLQDKVNWRSSGLKNRRKLQNAFPMILLFSQNDHYSVKNPNIAV